MKQIISKHRGEIEREHETRNPVTWKPFPGNGNNCHNRLFKDLLCVTRMAKEN